MAKIDKSSVVLTNSIIERLDKATKKVILDKANKVNHDFDSGVYRNNEIRDKLLKLYDNCCGYCQVTFSTRLKGDTIDHYRPKSYYYWLGYDWNNLIPICEACNFSKSALFPLIDETKKVKNHTEAIAQEQPYILNPEQDDYDEYIEYLPNGRVIGIDTLGRGEKTIQSCDMNDEKLIERRKKKIIDPIEIHRNIVFARKKIVDDVYRDLITKLADYAGNIYSSKNAFEKKVNDDIFERHFKLRKGESYTSLTGFMMRNFDTFFIKRIENEIGSIPAKLILDVYIKFVQRLHS